MELGELLLGVLAQRFADDHVATFDLDLHEGGSFVTDDPKRSDPKLIRKDSLGRKSAGRASKSERMRLAARVSKSS